MATTSTPASSPQALQAFGHATPQQLFRARCAEWAAQPALRHKQKGIWASTTWGQYYAQARAVGLALADLGLHRGDAIAVLSENRPEWLYADMGAQCLGILSTGIYPTSSPEQVQYILNDAGVRVLFVENQEQYDKAVAVRADCPALERIVITNLKGLRGLADPMVGDLRAVPGPGAGAGRAPGSTFRAGHRCRHAGRHRLPGLHLGHHGCTQGRDDVQPQPGVPDRQRKPVPRPAAAGPHPVVPAAVPHRRTHEHGLQPAGAGPDRAFPRECGHRVQRCARSGAAPDLRPTTLLGEAVLAGDAVHAGCHSHGAARLCPGAGRRRRTGAGAARRRAGDRLACHAVRLDAETGVVQPAQFPGPAEHQDSHDWRSPRATRPAALVHGRGYRSARGLRHDRDLRLLHLDATRPHQDRHGRRTRARHRDPPGRRQRSTGAWPQRVCRLLETARQDPRGHRRRGLAAHRRLRRDRRRRLPGYPGPAEGHHHHLGRQEHHARATSRAT